MLEMLRDLVAHKGYADAALLHAVRENDAAVSDPEIRELLHHVLLANRFWLCSILEVSFVLELESRDSSSFGELVQRYAGVHAREAAWLQAATDADLARMLDHPDIPGGRCARSQAWMQVCLHSHGHRSQCAKLLRNHGGVPPMTDFIVWLATRPVPAWE
jgi:uncharacterized damage-inducible protein DinB